MAINDITSGTGLPTNYSYISAINSCNSIPTPSILFDFTKTSNYSNSGQTIADLSGNGRNGTFVTGTGNGTPATVTGYDSTSPGRLNLPGDTPQRSVRLNDLAQFGGTSNFTIVTWTRLTSFTSTFPGLISAEGRSGATTIGYSFYLSNQSGYSMTFTRWIGTSGVGDFATLNFGSSGVPTFQFNAWYMMAARFDGSNLRVHAFISGYPKFTKGTASTGSITTSASWSAFMGLRYNNWYNGDFSYMSIYNSDIGEAALDTIYANTKLTYGHI